MRRTRRAASAPVSVEDLVHPPEEHHRIGADTREWLVGPARCPELVALRIHLCGISAARPGFSFARRGWEYGQVLACRAGSGQVWIDGDWRPCRAGQAYVCATGGFHAYCADADGWDVAWAILDDGLSPDDPAGAARAPWTVGPPRLVDGDTEAFAAAIGNLHREAFGPAQPALRGRWAELVALLAARLAGDDGAAHRLDQVWTAVDQDLARPWTLGDLARLAGVGGEQLRRLCQRHHGRSPVQQVAWLRMQRAALLLASRRATVGEVAAAVGYDNAFAFSTAFKRLHGRTPSSLRND